MARTTIMTVRIDPELLKALRARALREDRSVSAEVVRMIRAHVEPAPGRLLRHGTTMGMFPDLEAPELEDFKALRSEASSRVKTASAGSRRRSAP
jgi:hypothetical protein